MYWHDSREQHGTGRRVIQPIGELQGGLGGGYGGDDSGRGFAGGGARRRDAPNNGQTLQQARAPSYAGSELGGSNASRLQKRSEGQMFASASADADDRQSEALGPQPDSMSMRRGAPPEPSSLEGSGDPPIYDAHAVEDRTHHEGGRAYANGAEEDDYCPPPESLGGRRYIGCDDHIEDTGVSAPMPERYGRGRRYIEQQDHQVTRYDLEEGAGYTKPRTGQGRRAIQPADNLKDQVWKPVDEIQNLKPPSNVEMKESIQEWVVTVYDMIVYDEGKWAEVEVKPRGNQWVVECFTPQRKTISREGPTARAIAEKMSMMPIAELRHFGVRIATASERPPARREKKTLLEDNPTLVSPGVHNALGRDDRAPAGGDISIARKVPDAVQRRYIASGKDNFQACGQPLSHGRGHAKDTDFKDGMEKAIGQGRRYIGTKDSVHGVLYGGPK
mmetsp:Transcript_60073/g.167610  ORF Transcript_60073/g.167610 Transcript_60073/m.167610 type:complete len:445 (-) Transcript_60073:179-1513(-)